MQFRKQPKQTKQNQTSQQNHQLPNHQTANATAKLKPAN